MTVAAPAVRGTWRTPFVVMIGGGLILALSIGTRQSFGLYLQPMSGDMGWGRGVFAFAISLQNLLWGLAQPFVGALADRYGSGRVVAIGAVVYVAGLVMMSATDTAATLDIGAGVLVGLGLSGTGFGVVLSAVGRSFSDERRSMALGIAAAIGSFGQFAMVGVGQAFIASLGWSGALLIVAAFTCLILPLSTLLAGRAEVAQSAGTGMGFRRALAQAAAHRGFVLLCLGFFVCGFQITFMIAHLPAYFADLGATPTIAAAGLAAIGLSNIAGSLIWGWLGGRYHKKDVLAVLYLLRSVSVVAFMMMPASDASIIGFGAVAGFLFLATVPLTNAVVAQIFGVQHLAMLFGLVFLVHQLGAFLGVWLGGYLFDATGSYDIVWWLYIALGVLAAALHWPIDECRVVPA